MVSFFDYKSDEKKIAVFYGDSEEPIVNSNRTTEVGKEYKEGEQSHEEDVCTYYKRIS